MSATISNPKREVQIGAVFRRRDPNGQWVTFEVVSFTTTPYGQRAVRGKTTGGKVVTCSRPAMENGDPRFEWVHDNYVGRQR